MKLKTTVGEKLVELELDDVSQLAQVLAAIAQIEAPKKSKIVSGSSQIGITDISKKKQKSSRFNSGGTPHPQCFISAMEILDKPQGVTPLEILSEMQTNPQIDYRSSAIRPDHGIRQYLRNHKDVYQQVTSDHFAFTEEHKKLKARDENLF